MAAEQKRYGLIVSGYSNAAFLFEVPRDSGGTPVLWLRSEWDKPRPTKGTEFEKKIIQQIGRGPKMPEDFSGEGTVEDAIRILRRDYKVAYANGCMLTIALTGADEKDPAQVDEIKKIENFLEDTEVEDAMTTIGVAPFIHQTTRSHRGTSGVAKFHQLLKAAKAVKLETMFFGERE